jgi:hypothetical protein
VGGAFGAARFHNKKETPMRFAAPADVSAISLACGEFAVVDGFVNVPDDLGQGDLAGLVANGFTAVPVAAKSAKTPDPAPEPASKPESAPDAAPAAPEAA